jgi:pimeloyl-ACP methyl ester carboxylesterase
MDQIHELIHLELGAYKQYVSIHGNNTEKPIILMLHGGPGMSQIGYIRHFILSLENEFIVVNWDQRGAGKSYSSKIDPTTMNTKQLLSDTIDLTHYLLDRFGKQKIYLIGHSWGTVLGLKAVEHFPQLFEAYIAIAQIVNMQKGEQVSYNFTLLKARENNDLRAIKELKELGGPPYKSLQDNLIQRKYLDSFGGSTYSVKMKKLMKKATSLKEYNLWDWLYRFKKGIYFSLEHLKDELMHVEFDETIHEVKVPIYFFSGETDFQVPMVLTKTYFDQLVAPKKEFVFFEKCGHMIPFEQPEKFCNEVIRICSK